VSFSGGDLRNRMNYSSITFYRYRTEAMAEDVICLLDYLGWTADRELNIVGMSLGGMIAQGQ
jgi:pimeloyl-ACP methyl ester carboxylesterase